MISLQLFIDQQWQYVYLGEDTSIEYHWNNRVFSKRDSYTQDFKIPVRANMHLFGNVDHPHGEDIYRIIHGVPARIWVEGVVFMQGKVQLDSEVTIKDGSFDIEVVSKHKELDEILEGVNAQDVDISGEQIQIGYTTDTDHLPLQVQFDVSHQEVDPLANFGHMEVSKSTEEAIGYVDSETGIAHAPYMSIPHIMCPIYTRDDEDEENFVNTTLPYPSAPYCNVRMAHKLYYLDEEGNYQEKRGYQSHEPEMFNTPPCFYVAFWLEKLWKSLGIAVQSNCMENDGDFNRLAFYHTDCQYDIERAPFRHGTTPGVLIPEYFKIPYRIGNTVNKDYDAVKAKAAWGIGISNLESKKQIFYPKFVNEEPNEKFEIYGVAWKWRWRDVYKVKSVVPFPFLYIAYANSKNFPDEEASTILEGLESAFGIRYLYDSRRKTIDVVSIRDILASSEYEELRGDVAEIYVKENRVKGFRLKYAATSETEKSGISQQRQLVQGNDDTTFFYNDWRKVEQKEYNELIQHIGYYDKTCYISPTTGNAYRVKVDNDAKSVLELYPSLFEVAGYAAYEYGDCTDDDSTEEISIPFTPFIENDINYAKERDSLIGGVDETEGGEDAVEDTQPIMAGYVDVEIHPAAKKYEELAAMEMEYGLTDPMTVYKNDRSDEEVTRSAIAKFEFRMWFDEHFDISGGAEIPYQTNDTGYCLGIMRGSGGDAQTILTDLDYDGRGGSKWEITNGTNSAFTSDSIDHFGHVYDYNGSGDGTGAPSQSERISLKLRAEKPNPNLPGRYLPCTQSPHRGLGDQRYSEYAYWLTHRKKAIVTIYGADKDQISHLSDKKKYKVQDIVGLIDQCTTTFDNKKGITKTTVEIWYI